MMIKSTTLLLLSAFAAMSPYTREQLYVRADIVISGETVEVEDWIEERGKKPHVERDRQFRIIVEVTGVEKGDVAVGERMAFRTWRPEPGLRAPGPQGQEFVPDKGDRIRAFLHKGDRKRAFPWPSQGEIWAIQPNGIERL